MGGHRRLPMAELRAACTEAGLDTVATLGASGNLVFDGGPTEAVPCADLIASTIETAFGFRVPVMVRTAQELIDVLHEHPFQPPPEGEKMLHVVFCDRAPDPAAVAALDPNRSPGDEWCVLGRHIHVRYPNGSGRSKLTVDWLERELDVAATARNLPTVRKLAARAGGSEAG